jgi:hypothetical protein
MAQPSPLSALCATDQVVGAMQGRPYDKIRLNTKGWDQGELSMAA